MAREVKLTSQGPGKDSKHEFTRVIPPDEVGVQAELATTETLGPASAGAAADKPKEPKGKK